TLLTATTQAVHLWDVGSRKPLVPPLRLPEPIRAASFTPDGGRVVLFTSVDWLQGGTLRVCALPQDRQRVGERLLTYRQPVGFSHDGPAFVAFSRDGLAVETESRFGVKQRWEVGTGKLLAENVPPPGDSNKLVSWLNNEHVRARSHD